MNEIVDYEAKLNRFRSETHKTIRDIRAQYATELDNLLRRIGLAAISGHGESANEDAMRALNLQAKVSLLDELLEKIESEDV